MQKKFIFAQFSHPAERADALALPDNARCAFIGSYILGRGFILSPDERAALIARNPHNSARIAPYLRGHEVNASPTQMFDRYVIDFGQLSLAQAEEWPDLLAIVRAEVKPKREHNRRRCYRSYWWRFGECRPGLTTTVRGLARCLVAAIVSKHLMFSFQPTDRVFSHKLCVFALPGYSAFAVLQSRLHLAWAWLLSSTMRNAGINYAPSDCFETFPFPAHDPRSTIAHLEQVGGLLYQTRAAVMTMSGRGLTRIYNALADPACTESRVVELRRLHRAMDRAVLDAYGWTDIAVPPYCPASPAERVAVRDFKDAIIDRLYQLNRERGAGRCDPPSTG
ncbi:MAG: type IIL restriction-modification enzyme MmeI [Myxococcota bacterium]